MRLPFREDHERDRARNSFNNRVDTVHRNFKSANRPWSGYHFKTLMAAAQETAEDLAERAISAGVERTVIDGLTFDLFDEFVAEIRLISRGKPQPASSIAVIDRAEGQSRVVLAELLGLCPSPQRRAGEIERWDDETMKAAIAECPIANRDKAWRDIFKPLASEHGWTLGDFRIVWSDFRGTKGLTGRPPRRA